MSKASALIESAFERLKERPGFVERVDQRQLALLISDLIEEGSTGAFEAPTGLGKSLAALIPAIAHALASGKRTVIATYTNVLAEQYWRHDLPLALTLFDNTATLRRRLLMGRQRYVCLAEMDEHAPDFTDYLKDNAELGIESEFRKIIRKPYRELGQLWQKVVTPPVCPGRNCPAYDDCFYYSARREAEKAEIVITNHSVVITDALLASADEDKSGLLGKFDFLIVDEAHDFYSAAINGLEFELNSTKLSAMQGVVRRLETLLLPLAQSADEGSEWQGACAHFQQEIERCQKAILSFSLAFQRPGIIDASPPELMEHPQVVATKTDRAPAAQSIANVIAETCARFTGETEQRINRWKSEQADRARTFVESSRTYLSYVRDFGIGCHAIFVPDGISVSYAGRNFNDVIFRRDVIGVAEPLRELVWNRTPYACLSATLALDGNFDFFSRSTGAEPSFMEILPSPFDYPIHAAIYLPKHGAIHDPGSARKMGIEEDYFRTLAHEIGHIIRVMNGRTLVLFHSRKEMEGVYRHIASEPERPILMQLKTGTADVGQRFVGDVSASLFALRSFWTGFDAPGETLSCVVLVRIPFEVPVDPPQIARLAYLQTLGLDAFREHTLPLAKMLMRQGAGRLLRRAEDKGIIAILDSRLTSKNYGEEILENLPPGMRVFRDFEDAAGYLGF